MASALLQTKVYVPRPRRGSVSRGRLSDRLDRGADESGLILVSAPAGFGKTTLLADWLAAAPADRRTVAWLSLDASDNDPARFWTYVIAAIQSVLPEFGAQAREVVQSPETSLEAVIATLLNEIGALSRDVVLVLDDYHVVEAQSVHDGMAFLLDHVPPQLHLVIATRADPPLPLPRLRAGGRLVEIRAADLRFTPGEAAAYLNGVMGLSLSAGDVSALEERTEGWIAALQLAAISMQGRDDVTGFIAGFAGDDRYVVDYLIEEVLRRQSEGARNFLLQTAFLDRLNGALCDAVTGRAGGKAMLEALERGNLFLVPLDDQRQWYRYHHLFGDVLRMRLVDEQPEQVAELHRRASLWHEQNGDTAEAIGHALAARDFERAADLVELAVPLMRRLRQEATVLGWLRALPHEVVERRPVLSVHYAGTLLLNGELEGVEVHLRDAERWLDLAAAGRAGPGSAAMRVVDEEEFGALPSGIATYRAASALIARDVAGTMKSARLALELAPQGDHLRHGSAAGLLALAYWWNGDLEVAYHWYAECLASLLRAGHVSDSLGVAISLADIRLVQGRLGEAARIYEQALERANPQDGPVLRGTADMHVGLSEVLREHNDLAGAMQHLVKSQELGEYSGLEQNRYRSRVAMARLAEAEGDLDGALGLLDEAGRQSVSVFLPNVRPVTAMKARVLIALGKLAEAQAWAREIGISTEDDLDYLREFEHMTLARILVAQSKRDRSVGSTRLAMELLDRLLLAAEAGQRMRSVIEILVLQAMAHHAEANIPAALVPLERALALAEPEGYVRLFADEGPAMLALLEVAAKRRITMDYLPQILASFGGRVEQAFLNRGLIEALSERELDVLRLLGSDLDGPAIANELSVSLNTLRTHTKNIYAKLGVNSRRAAVSRAGELELLARTRER